MHICFCDQPMTVATNSRCAHELRQIDVISRTLLSNARTAIFFSFVRSNLTVMSGTSDLERLREGRALITMSKSSYPNTQQEMRP